LEASTLEPTGIIAKVARSIIAIRICVLLLTRSTPALAPWRARGFIQRHTVEINMDKIESVDVDQSIMGRAFNYGDVTIRGTGQTFEPLRQIDRPIDFRNEVTAR
jgi:hypothetical protein